MNLTLDTFATLWTSLTSAPCSEAIARRIQAFTAACEPCQSLESSLLRAELHRRSGRLQAAIEALADIHQLHQSDEPLELQALAWLTWGHLKREQGFFEDAAKAFIQAFALQPTLLASLHALQFTRLTFDQKSDLANSLSRVIDGCQAAPPLALQLLADWQQELGAHVQSLQLSYLASQRSVTAVQRRRLDRVNPPSLPEALIIGAPKSGTTSLAGWLAAHPQIFVHPRKELHFFDSHRWDWGKDWYRCQFPRFSADDPPIVRMEATPNYLQLGQVPERVQQLMPEARMIVILRHPVNRALSWCHHIIRQEGVEASPEQILAAELGQFLDSGEAGWLDDGGWHPTNCLFGSLYTRQLERWRQVVGPERLLVLQMESTLRNPASAWQAIAPFLGLGSWASYESAGTNAMALMPHLNSAPAVYDGLSEAIARGLKQALEPEIQYWDSIGIRNAP